MGGRSILDLVDRFHCRVDGCIKTDRVICARDIQVDGPGDADRVDPVAGQRLGAAVGSVAADDDDTVDPVLIADIRRFLLHFLFLELRASRRPQNGTSLMYDTGDIHGFHLTELFVQESLVSSLDPDDLALIVHCFSCDRTDRRVHSGRVAAAGQYANFTYFFRHNRCLRIFKAGQD